MKPGRFLLAAALTAGALLSFYTSANAPGMAGLTEAELNAVLSHGPWPMKWSPDPSNRVSGNAHAVDLGERLFFDERLSVNGKVSCGTCHIKPEQRHIGEFKVPSLRNVGYTGPYMHSGEFRTIDDVIRHYSELNVDRLHAGGGNILKPLRLTNQESADLAAFLFSLNMDRAPPWRGKEYAHPPCVLNTKAPAGEDYYAP